MPRNPEWINARTKLRADLREAINADGEGLLDTDQVNLDKNVVERMVGRCMRAFIAFELRTRKMRK